MNPDRAAIVLARYRGLAIVRAQYRSAGRKPPRMREQREDAEAYLAKHPELVAQACAALDSFAQRQRR